MRAILPLLLAGSFSVPAPNLAASDPVYVSTVALAGDQVVWVEHRGAAAVLVAATSDGARRDVLALRSVPSRSTRMHGITASGGTAIVQRIVCRDARCERPPANESVRVDLATGAASPFDPCPSLGISDYALRANLLTTGRGCETGVLVDLTDGSTHALGERLAAASGRYAVIAGDDDLRLVDWRTRARIRRVSDANVQTLSEDVGLGEDGTLAWTGPRGVEVLRPGQGRSKVVQPRSDFVTRVAVTGDRLVVHRYDDPIIGTHDVTVSALDGSAARTVDGQRGAFGWAVDGARVAWVAQPCAVPAIQVWDLAGSPPPPVSEDCGRTRLPTGPLRLGPRRTVLRMSLSCPAAPGDGCAGVVNARFRSRGRVVAETYRTEYAIPAGATRTVRMRVYRASRLRGRSGVKATVDLFDRSGGLTTRRFGVQG